MTLNFPSREFDEAVAGVCHGTASEDQQRALNELLRSHPAARDEYLIRVELHVRLASSPDLFASTADSPEPPVAIPRPPRSASPVQWGFGILALAASAALLAMGWWTFRPASAPARNDETSKAVALLNRVVDAQWAPPQESPRSGAPLEPGRLKLVSGLAQIVFYSGARVVIEGPAELELISPAEAVCTNGRLLAEVPPQARGFRIRTPRLDITDLGTVFGTMVRTNLTELHVFQGQVEIQSPSGRERRTLSESQAIVAHNVEPPRLIPPSRSDFAPLFDLRLRSSEADILRHEQWRAASGRLDEDPSLLVHLDFESAGSSEWRLVNATRRRDAPLDATLVGCQWAEGRWPDKRALELRGVSDRVRLDIPGEFDALTLAIWLRVQGLDRQINSLFMSDGFAPRTLHWSIRNDGVLALTAIGPEEGEYQICATPPVLTLTQFGLWVHLAVVIDGSSGRVVHYLNGTPVGEELLRIQPPFRVGAAELGNWNALGFPRNDPFMIRNFSGAMDEFFLFSRPLSGPELHALYLAGKPQSDPSASDPK